MKRWIGYAPLRPLAGGIAVALAVWLLGTDRYIGLGIPTIVDALKEPLPPRPAWATWPCRRASSCWST